MKKVKKSESNTKVEIIRFIVIILLGIAIGITVVNIFKEQIIDLAF